MKLTVIFAALSILAPFAIAEARPKIPERNLKEGLYLIKGQYYWSNGNDYCTYAPPQAKTMRECGVVRRGAKPRAKLPATMNNHGFCRCKPDGTYK